MRKLIVKRWTRDGKVTIELSNYSGFDGEISVYDISGDNAADAVPKADFMSEMEGQFTKVWKITVPPKETLRISYAGKGGGILEIRGIDDAKKMVVDLDV
jgi:DNA topoisomerase-6 subunit B